MYPGIPATPCVWQAPGVYKPNPGARTGFRYQEIVK